MKRLKEKEENWEITKKILNKCLIIPEKILDYITMYDLLLLSVSGKSNTYINENTGFEISFIIDTLNEYLNFNGWNNSLNINPIFIFRDVDRDKEKFWKICSSKIINANISDNKINIAFNICKNFIVVEEVLDEWYTAT